MTFEEWWAKDHNWEYIDKVYGRKCWHAAQAAMRERAGKIADMRASQWQPQIPATSEGYLIAAAIRALEIQ